jgi:ATP-binding cassette subfamily F protein uup
MAAPPILLLQDIALSFGGTPLLVEAELSIGPGERLCLVGRNGSGKSTLLKIAAGHIEPDSGKRFLQPGKTVRYLAQEPDLTGHATVIAYVEAGLEPGDDANRARYLLEHLGLEGDKATHTLSGGEARRAALARVLAAEPDIMLLDEPTNHLDLPSIEWLEGEIAAARGAVVLISHDRRFLENLSRATVWLDRGRTLRIDRGFAHFEAWRDEVLEREERDAHKLERKIVMEEDWLRYGVTARRKRNQRRLANLHSLRDAHRTRRRAQGTVTLENADATTSGKLVAEAEAVTKAYGGRVIVRDFSIKVLRGDRVGIVGPNGAGKTTLLKLLTGEIAPDAGRVRRGTRLDMVSLDQRRESLDPELSVSDALTGGRGDFVEVGGRRKHVTGYMKDFLFAPEQARTPVGALSGGERGRLMLARALAVPSNLLVLDEPTNDLDLETLDLLQELLTDYDGTLLLVSHDRDFLDRVVTSVVACDPQGTEGTWIEYAGGYSDMIAQREGAAARPVAPQRRKGPAAPARDAAPANAAARRRLSFTERHRLDTLPGEIERLQSEVRRLEAVLAQAGLFGRDRAAFEKASKALAETRTALAAADAEWFDLELKREELEDG